MFHFFCALFFTFFSSLTFAQSSMPELDALCQLGTDCPAQSVMIDKEVKGEEVYDREEELKEAALAFSSKMNHAYSYVCSFSEIECLENFPPIVIGFDELALHESRKRFLPFGCDAMIHDVIEIWRDLNVPDLLVCLTTYLTVQEFDFEGIETPLFKEHSPIDSEVGCSNADSRRSEIFSLIAADVSTKLAKVKGAKIKEFRERIDKNKALLEEGCF